MHFFKCLTPPTPVFFQANAEAAGSKSGSQWGTGGIATKLRAAQLASAAGITTAIHSAQVRYVYIYIYVHICKQTCILMYTHTTRTCMYVYMCICVCMHMYIYLSISIYLYVYLSIYLYIYIYIYIYMYIKGCLPTDYKRQNFGRHSWHQLLELPPPTIHHR